MAAGAAGYWRARAGLLFQAKGLLVARNPPLGEIVADTGRGHGHVLDAGREDRKAVGRKEEQIGLVAVQHLLEGVVDFLALGLVYWLRMARIVRAQVLSLKELEYILAARVLGASHRRLIFGHLLPNSLGPIIITLTLSIPEAIFTEAFLSFIGLGVSAPMASWGVLASEGVVTLRSYPFQLLSPAIAISLTMLGFNFLGDGLRDALDPRMRR